MKGVVAGVAAFIVLAIGLLVPFVPVTTNAPYQTEQNQSIPIFQIADTTIQPNHYVYVPSPLSVGQDASVTWSASATVDVYIFSSSQYAAYANSGTTSNFMASQTNAQSGTIGFHVSVADTYYFVVHNGHNGFLGLGSSSVGLYSAGGTASSQQIVTLTTTTSCNENLLSALSGGHC